MYAKHFGTRFLGCSLSVPQAQRSDELDIHTDDELEILEWDDGDGWCKGRDRGGKEGYFPQSYVQPSSRSPSPPNSGQAGQQQQSLSSSAQDTNNNCNGNGKYLSVPYRAEIVNIQSVLLVKCMCWEGANVYNQNKLCTRSAPVCTNSHTTCNNKVEVGIVLQQCCRWIIGVYTCLFASCLPLQ